MIPWRVKNLTSERFPLFYYWVNNFGRSVNSTEYWDEIYHQDWTSPKREWPTKNHMITERTDKNDTVLDIACGTGSILRHLQNQGYHSLYGTELSNICIERLSALGISMFKSQLPRISCSNDRFDVVIASQILEHIVRRNTFLREIKRVMKPGGQAFIFVPDDCLGPISEPSHVTKFTALSFDKQLRKTFDDVTIRSFKDKNFEMSILFAHIRTLSVTKDAEWLSRKPQGRSWRVFGLKGRRKTIRFGVGTSSTFKGKKSTNSKTYQK